MSGDDFDLEGTASEVRKLGRRSLAAQVDVTKENDIDTFVQKIVKELGTVDILANVAGKSSHETLRGMTPEVWNTAMDVNLRSVYLCSQAVSKVMIPRQRGNIINWASLSAFKLGTASAYGIAKAGIMALTGWAAKEFGEYNIRVNAIAPGAVATDFGKHRIGRPPWEIAAGGRARPEPMPQGTRAPNIPLGRSADASDIADVAVFLASDASRYITGQTIIVDGRIMVS